MSKTYQIRRSTTGVTVAVVSDDSGHRYPLALKDHRHSTGFEFGYAGSGPAELARQILWDFLDEEPHPACYQDFKVSHLIAVDNSGFDITEIEITAWLQLWSGPGQCATLREHHEFLGVLPR